MAIVIKKASDNIPFANLLLYADSGTGKTVFAGSDARVLFLAPENDGMLSAIRMGSKADKIDVFAWEDMKEAYEWLYAHPEVFADYDWLVVDSITEMQDMAKKYVIRMTANEKKRKGHDPEVMQLQDYGTMHTLVENMVRGLNELPVNLLWTATAKKVEDADGNEFLVPELQGKKEYGISMKMASLMTSYGYMRVEFHEVPAPTEEQPDAIKVVKRRVVYWEDTGTIRGKDRTTRLAPFTVNATLQQVRRAIKGDLVRQKDGKLVAANKVDANAVAPTQQPKIVKAKPDEKADEKKDEKDGEQASPDQPKPVESTPAPLTGEVGQKFEKENNAAVPVEIEA